MSTSSTTRTAYDRCFKKRLFFSREAAAQHIDWLWQMHGTNDVEVYPCDIGESGPHFHVGHKLPRAVGQNLQRYRTVGRQTVLAGTG